MGVDPQQIFTVLGYETRYERGGRWQHGVAEGAALAHGLASTASTTSRQDNQMTGADVGGYRHHAWSRSTPPTPEEQRLGQGAVRHRQLPRGRIARCTCG